MGEEKILFKVSQQLDLHLGKRSVIFAVGTREDGLTEPSSLIFCSDKSLFKWGIWQIKMRHLRKRDAPPANSPRLGFFTDGAS